METSGIGDAARLSALSGPEDERAILRAHYQYGRALDERDWAALDFVFDGNCEARYGDGPALIGRAAIVAGIREHLDNAGPSQHLISNVIVAFTDGALTSHAAVQAVHRAAQDERMFTSFATYSARWVRTGHGLRACEWRMEIGFNHGDSAVLAMREHDR